MKYVLLENKIRRRVKLNKFPKLQIRHIFFINKNKVILLKVKDK